jgi:DNA polymerase III psi subunit
VLPVPERGKSDEIDAVAAARTALASAAGTLAAPRADGIRSALRVLLVARRAIDTRRTADRNMLTALLRSLDLGIDARKPLTDAQVRRVAAWRARRGEDTALQTIREEAPDWQSRSSSSRARWRPTTPPWPSTSTNSRPG